MDGYTAGIRSLLNKNIYATVFGSAIEGIFEVVEFDEGAAKLVDKDGFWHWVPIHLLVASDPASMPDPFSNGI